MKRPMERREFLQIAAGCTFCAARGMAFSSPADPGSPALVSPGCRKSRVRIAKIYLCAPNVRWPHPQINLNTEITRFEMEFRRLRKHFSDVDFTVDEVVGSREQARDVAPALKDVDGILALHLSIGVQDILGELLKSLRPAVLFASPSSPSDWARLEPLRSEDSGPLLDFILTSDLSQLAAAIRPFRAMHHLREAKIVNISTQPPPAGYVEALRDKFGTEIKTIGAEPIIEAYNSIGPAEAEAETERWIREAEKVMEPQREEILRSCKLALAFDRLLEIEQATVLTVDCYGSMYRRLPALPCLGFVRLNGAGLGGVCESDLGSAITHIVLQGLSGRAGSTVEPATYGEARDAMQAYCLGCLRPDGPGGDAAPYVLRTINERQEGCVPQIRMGLGRSVTQARLADQDTMFYFTGRIVDMPDVGAGCRPRITLEIDGDAGKLETSWSKGLRRTAVFGDLTQDLKRFCRFKEIRLINEA